MSEQEARVEYRRLNWYRLGDHHRLEVQSTFVMDVPIQELATDAQYHGALLDYVIRRDDQPHTVDSVGVMQIKRVDDGTLTLIQDDALWAIFLDLVETDVACYEIHVDTFIHNVYVDSMASDKLPREDVRWFLRGATDCIHFQYEESVNRVFLILASDLWAIRVFDASTLKCVDAFSRSHRDNVKDQIRRYVNSLLES